MGPESGRLACQQMGRKIWTGVRIERLIEKPTAACIAHGGTLLSARTPCCCNGERKGERLFSECVSFDVVRSVLGALVRVRQKYVSMLVLSVLSCGFLMLIINRVSDNIQCQSVKKWDIFLKMIIVFHHLMTSFFSKTSSITSQIALPSPYSPPNRLLELNMSPPTSVLPRTISPRPAHSVNVIIPNPWYPSIVKSTSWGKLVTSQSGRYCLKGVVQKGKDSI
ncbi:unnamed protein product [Larinioides sclopetarius]|uniref:SRCR domain-containing protein n=1 Tax=Larinioides sclopetarius TaxID=280406 RepID=A0AAV2ARG7_9ARAC